MLHTEPSFSAPQVVVTLNAAFLIDIALFVSAVGLIGLAAWLQRRRPPALEPERLFKTTLATLLQGGVEGELREGITQKESRLAMERWADSVRRALFFHPSWREGWAKLDDPLRWDLPIPAGEGELALIEALRSLSPGKDRFECFLQGEHQSLLLEDPTQLGAAYDPGRWLAPDLHWEHVARANEPLERALARRLDALQILLVHGPELAADALGVEAGFVKVLHTTRLELQGAPLAPQEMERVVAKALEGLRGPADRLALVGLGDSGLALVGAMAGSAELRERVTIVTLLGVPLLGIPEPPEGREELTEEAMKSWLKDNIRQETLDVELHRSTPWILLPRVRPDSIPAGDGRVPWRNQRMDEPPWPPSGRHPIRVVELGPLSADSEALPAHLLAPALLMLWVALQE